MATMTRSSKYVLANIMQACSEDVDMLNHAEDYRNIINNDDYIKIEWGIQSRLDLIKLAIKKTKANCYLEIGCDEDKVFSNINVPIKVGVDPKQGGNVRLTSDEFFSSNTQKFDVIFVDGLHLYEQVKQDVFNSLEFLNEGGIIIIHDMLPMTKKQTALISGYYGWQGEVWRLGFDLMAENNIDFKIVNIDLGCGIILPGCQKKEKYQNEKWEDYLVNYKNLPIVSYEEIKKILSN